MVVVFAATILVIVKNFMGQERNVPRGVGLLLGVAVVAFLASQPDVLLGIGETIAGLVRRDGA